MASKRPHTGGPVQMHNYDNLFEFYAKIHTK